MCPSAEDIEIFVSLGQSDGRIRGEDGSYSKYPFKEKLVTAHIAIWELEDGETMLKQYVKGKPLIVGGPVRTTEIPVRTNLKKGKRYVIVCSPMDQGTIAEFYLSIYVSCELHDVQIERIGNPKERCKFLL